MMANENSGLSSEPTGPRLAVECPDCGYCLRGLAGERVRCPECGESCDVARLAQQYRSTWSATPTYQRLMRPVMVSLSAIVAAMVLIGLILAGAPLQTPLPIAIMSMMLVGMTMAWTHLARAAVRAMHSSEAWKFMMMLHVVAVGYLVCGLGVFIGITGLLTLPIAIFNDSVDGLAIVICSALTVVGAVCTYLFIPLWQLDQHVGRACLQHTLGSSATAWYHARHEC